VVFVHKSYVIQLMAIDNHVFSLFEPYSTLIWVSSGQSRMNIWILIRLLNWH